MQPSRSPKTTPPSERRRAVVVSTGDDADALARMEESYAAHLEAEGVQVELLRLGRVESLLAAYGNAFRLVEDPSAMILFAHQDSAPLLPATGEGVRPGPLLQRAPWLAPALVRPTAWVRTAVSLLARESTGLLGVAGARRLEAGRAWWEGEELTGAVVHRTPEGRETINAYGPWGRAAVLDGLLLMARGDYAARIEPLAPRSGFHFYDMELALRGLRAGLSHWTVPLLLEHRSGGAAADEEDYLRQRQAFEARFAGQLPVDVPPAPTPGVETP